MKKLLPLLILFFFCSPKAYTQNASYTPSPNTRWVNTDQMPDKLRAFQENKGQFVNNVNDWKVLYGTDYQGTRVLFTDKGVIYILPENINKDGIPEDENGKNKEEIEKGMHKVIFHTVAIKWENASTDLSVEPIDETPYYFGGVDPVNQGKSIENVKGYGRIVYHNVYPGIDIEYTFHPKKGLKYAVKVKAGYSTDAFKMQYDGQDNMFIDASGNVHLATPVGDIVDHAPISSMGGSKVESSFKKLSNNEVEFSIGAGKLTSDLVIDPWTVSPITTTFVPVDIGMDAASNTYIYGAVQSGLNTYEQQYDPTGKLIWTYNFTTFSGYQYVSDLAVDVLGNSYVAAPYYYSNASGVPYALISLTPSSALRYFNNTYSRPADGSYDGIFEIWNLTFSCDHQTIVEAGAYEYSTYQVAVVNATNGNVYSIDSGNVNTSGEVYAGCYAPNGNYYAMTANQNGVDSIYSYTNTGTKVKTNWEKLTNYRMIDYSGKTPVGIGSNTIVAGCNNLYTMNGYYLDQKDINTGAEVKRVVIPGGDSLERTGGYGNATGGLAIDLECGYVYVGSVNNVYIYDINLNPVSSVAAPGPVYDVTYDNGLVSATGGSTSSADFVLQFSAIKCTPNMTHTNTTCGLNNGTATITPTFCAPPYKYVWNPSGQTSATATGLSAGTYTVDITTGSACVSVSDTVTIGPSKPMTVTAAVTSSGKCNSDITATITGGVNPVKYIWSSGQTTSTINGVPSGTYTITATDSVGCIISATVTATSGGPTVTTKPTGITCFGGTNGVATVTPAGGTPPYTYDWIPSGSSTPTINNLTAGSYTCVVKDAGGCVDTVGVLVKQPSPLRDSAINIIPATCGAKNGGASVGVKGGTGLTYKYSWAPGGGTAATITNVSGGSYTVTVTDSNGCSNTAVAVIPAAGSFRDSVTNTPITCFGGKNATATVGTAGGIAPYTYNWSDGQTSQTATGLSAGVYTVTVKDSGGCPSVIIDTIKAPSQVVGATAGDSICIGQTANLVGSAVGGTAPYTYTWNSTTTAATYSVTPATSTTYTLVVTDANGCTSAPVIVAVIVDPPLSVTTSRPAAMCPGNSTTITASGKGGDGKYTYTWIPGGLTGPSITVTPTVTTEYVVTLTDNCGSPAVKDSVLITMDPIPTPLFSADTLNGCYPLCVQFTDLSTVTSGKIKNWSWNFGNDSTSTAQNGKTCYINPGKYSVGLTVTSDSGCTAQLTIPNMITVYDHPHASYIYAPQPTTIMQPLIQFTDKSTDLYTITNWFWNFNDQTDSTSSIQNPSHTFVDTGTFCPMLTVTDMHGCKDSVTECVVIEPFYTLYIPTAFTPNGDGINDMFIAKGIYVCSFEMYIFDRWGQQLYHTNDIYKGWDGVVGGNGGYICQEDTYVYLIYATDCEQHAKHSYIGKVTLIR